MVIGRASVLVLSEVQAQTALLPHVCDTAVMFVTFLRSGAAAKLLSDLSGIAADSIGPGDSSKILEIGLGPGAKIIDAALLQQVPGKGAHRLKECKHLLRVTDPGVLMDFIGWRKKAHFEHANAFAQYYLLSEEWVSIQGQVPRPSETWSTCLRPMLPLAMVCCLIVRLGV